MAADQQHREAHNPAVAERRSPSPGLPYRRGHAKTAHVDSPVGRVALLICHCAGMVDLIAMPVWMEVLITQYRFSPQRAGALVSVFLLAAVLTSSLLAARFTRVNSKAAAVCGFAIAAAVFALSTTTTDFRILCSLYVLGGAGVGCGLSMTHGAMGRSANPHRIFALAGAAAGFFSIGFYGAVSAAIARHGGASLFWLLAGVMGVAMLVAALAFPSSVSPKTEPSSLRTRSFSPQVWLAILGVIGMALNQAIAASFLQNIGLARNFGAGRVEAVLIGLALLALIPGPLAIWLQRKVSARVVLVTGPLVQIAIVVVISRSLIFWPYAIAGALSTSVQIFVHAFAFGFIARADRSARATAATPAMLMTGSAIGPFLAGSLVAGYGYATLGYAAVVVGVMAALCYMAATKGTVASAKLEIG